MADSKEIVTWEKEVIPLAAHLFMRVHKMHVSDGDFNPGAFRNQPTPQDGMSTDWEKYSTPANTRNRAKRPADNGVISMQVAAVADIPGQRVEHTPDVTTKNRAHTDVFGPKSDDPEVRLKFKRIAKWVPGFQIG